MKNTKAIVLKFIIISSLNSLALWQKFRPIGLELAEEKGDKSKKKKQIRKKPRRVKYARNVRCWLAAKPQQ